MRKKKMVGSLDVTLIPEEIIEKKIFLMRGKKVMLDRDLAELYAVTTSNLNKAVKRNVDNFPDDFIFQLTKEEASRFQNGILKRGQNIKYLPYVFTEQGVAMLSSVLKSKRAIQVNIVIMRVFVRLKEIISNHKELVFKLRELENKLEKHDGEIHAIFEAIRDLMEPPPAKRKPKIGFHQ